MSEVQNHLGDKFKETIAEAMKTGDFRSAALSKSGRNVEFTAFLLFFCFKKFEHL